LAAGTGATGIYETPNSNQVANLVPRNARAYIGHSAYDLVPWNHREGRATPFVTSLVDVGVTHTAKQDLYHDIVPPRGAAVKLEGL
jgi:hypothetical protein